jgi:TP901 family phage tail tape measure protein
MGSSSIRAGQAYIELTTKDSKLVKGLANAQLRLKAFGASVTDLGAKFAGLFAAMAVPLGFVTKNFADFDDQMRLFQGLTGIADDKLEDLTETARKLGRETSYTAAQVAAGMVALARMGFTADEVNRSIKNFMNLDRATGMKDLGMSAEIAAAAMRSFGMSAASTSRIADVLTATANGSSQTLTDVGEALKMAAPNARMANATLEDTCAMLGVLANMGIKGSMAGAALAKTFQRLASGKGVAVLEGKGIQTKDANGNLRNMRDILTDIAKVTKTMGTADKIAFLTDVFDVRGVKGGGLIAGNLKDLDAMIDKIAKSGGLAEETARKMDSGIGGAFRIFNAALSDVGLEIGKIVGEYIRPYMDAIGGVLNHISKWAKENKEIIIGIVKVGAAVGAAGAALLALGATVKILAFSCGGLAMAFRGVAVAVMLPLRAFALLASVIGLVKTAIAGIPVLIAAVKTAALTAAVAIKAFAMSGVFAKAAMVLLTGAVGVAKLAVLAAIGAMSAATLAVRGLMLGVTGLKIVITAIPPAFAAVKAAIAATVAVLSAAKAAFLGLHLAVNLPIVAVGLLHIAMVKIRAVFVAMSAVVAAVRTAITGFNIVTAVSSGIVAAWGAAIAGCKAVAVGFAAAFGAAKTAIMGFSVVQAASAGIQAAWNAVVGASKTVMLTMTAAFAAAKAAIVGFNIATAASRVLMVAWNGILAVGKAIMTAFAAVFGAARTAVMSFNIVQAVGTGLQAAYNAVMHAGTVVIGLFTAALTALKTVFLTLKVVSVAAWTAALGPTIAFIAVAGAVVAIVMLMTDAFNMVWNAILDLGDGFSAAFATIREVARDSYDAIKIAFAAGDLAGAAKVGLAALSVVWREGLMPLKKAWYDFRYFLADSWTFVVGEIAGGANELWYGLLSGLKSIGNGIANAWDSLWNGIIGAFEATIGNLKKKWIQFKGFFDDDVDVDVEIRKVDEEIAANRTERARRSNEAVNRRAGEARQLDDERERSAENLRAMTEREMRDNRADYEQMISDASRGIEDAKRSWRDAMEEVRKNAAAKDASPAAARIEDRQKKIEDSRNVLEGRVSGKVFGDFSARAAMMAIGDSGIQEKIAQFGEETAKNTKDMADEFKNNWTLR